MRHCDLQKRIHALILKDAVRIAVLPWRFLSIITRERSIDFYCDDEQINDIFYGMKYFLTDNNVPFKINSVNYYLLNKTKIKIAIELKKKYQEEDEENVPNIVHGLLIPFYSIRVLDKQYFSFWKQPLASFIESFSSLTCF